jgi:hypothetical protein
VALPSHKGLLFGKHSIWVYGLKADDAMKTTVEVSDDLYRRAKAEAALRGRKLKDCGLCSKLRANRIGVGAWPRW